MHHKNLIKFEFEVCMQKRLKNSNPQPKKGKMFIPNQPGRTNKQKWRGTLVLNLLTYNYKKQKLKWSENNKMGRSYLMAKGQKLKPVQ